MSAFPLLSEVRFYPAGLANLANYGSFPSDQGGFYPRQIGALVATIFSGTIPSNYASIEKSAFGFDLAGGFIGGATAPADATVISPLTSLLTGSNTEAKLERQLGLDGSVFQLSTDRAIKTYSPSLALASTDPNEVAEGQRLVATHLRILAVSTALAYMGGNGLDPSGVRFNQRELLRTFLDNAPAQFIFTNSVMSQILRSAAPNGQSGPVYSDQVISAAAHLVDAYCATLGVRIATPEEAARWQLGIYGYLIPELTRLLRANDSATAIEFLAITNPQILAATQRFTEQIPVTATQGFFPQPDFYPIASGATRIVPAVDEGSNGDGPLNSNDFALRSSETNGIGGGETDTSVTAVTVPSANAGQVSAVLNSDGTISITARAGFTGVTYFDYTVRLKFGGETRQGRVYLIAR